MTNEELQRLREEASAGERHSVIARLLHVIDQRDREIKSVTAERDKAQEILRDVVDLLEERWVRGAT